MPPDCLQGGLIQPACCSCRPTTGTSGHRWSIFRLLHLTARHNFRGAEPHTAGPSSWRHLTPTRRQPRATALQAKRSRPEDLLDFRDEEEEPAFLWDEAELARRDTEASLWLAVAGVLAACALLAPMLVDDNEPIIRQHLLDGLPSSGKRSVDSSFSLTSPPRV